MSEIKIIPFRNLFSERRGVEVSVSFPWSGDVASFSQGGEGGPPEIEGRGMTEEDARTALAERLKLFADQLETLAAQARDAAENVRLYRK